MRGWLWGDASSLLLVKYLLWTREMEMSLKIQKIEVRLVFLVSCVADEKRWRGVVKAHE